MRPVPVRPVVHGGQGHDGGGEEHGGVDGQACVYPGGEGVPDRRAHSAGQRLAARGPGGDGCLDGCTGGGGDAMCGELVRQVRGEAAGEQRAEQPVPMTEPTCRAVLTAPEAMPACSGATLTSAAAVLGAATRPQAAPNRASSGQTLA